MIFNAIKKITGIEKDANVKGAAGTLKYAADILLYFAVFFYTVAVGVILPLYLPGYDTLGTDKGKFWIGELKLCGIVLLPAIALYILCFILKISAKAPAKKPKVYRTDIWAAIFIICVLISFALSDEKQIALYGERGWYTGTMSSSNTCRRVPTCRPTRPSKPSPASATACMTTTPGRTRRP